MKLCTYQISERNIDDDLMHKWQIDITFKPSWIEKVLGFVRCQRRQTLIGNYNHWCWQLDSHHLKPANIVWRLWAQYRLKIYHERHANNMQP